MALDPTQFAAQILAELCLARAFTGNQLGVFVEDVPPLDPQAFVNALAAATPKPLRVALLGGRGRRSVKPQAKLKLTTDETEANRWRNDAEVRGGTPTVVLVLGPAAKLNSLRDALTPLGAAELRRAVVTRAIGLLESPERRALWQMLGHRKGDFPTETLLKFAAFAEGARAKSTAALLDQEPKGVHLLNLLPHKALFEAGGAAAARRAVQRNLDMRRRLEGLLTRERQELNETIERGSPAEKHAAKAILRFAKTKNLADLDGLSFEDIEQALKRRAKSEPEPVDGDESGPERPRRERIDGDELAAKLLIEQGGKGLPTAAKRYRSAIEPSEKDDNEPEEVQVGRQTFLPRPKVGTSQGTALFGRLVSEEVWGGVVTARGPIDFVGTAKLVASENAEFHEFRPSREGNVRELLQRAVDSAIGPGDALARWDDYVAARAKLLAHTAALIDHPILAIAGDASLRADVDALLETFGHALAAIRDTAEALRTRSPGAARGLLASALCLDVVFLLSEEERAAVAAPTHPFHLFRCAAMASILRENGEELSEIGGLETIKPFLTDPVACAPHLVLSPFATQVVDRAIPFAAVGSFGALPQFAELTARRLGKFRARSLKKIAERLIRLMPHASLGLRVAIIDPPSVAGALEDLVDLPSSLDDEALTPIHAVVFATRQARETTDEEDEAVDALARELRDAGGSLSFEPPMASLADVAAALKKDPVHLAVVFDPGEGKSVTIGVAAPPPLSPLTVPRAYHYDEFLDQLDVVIAGDSPIFSAYHDLFCEALSMPRTNFLGRRSGASESATNLSRIAESALWAVVVDQGIEPTLGLRPAVLIDTRTDAGRDVVTFTAHPDAIEALIRDAVRAAGLVADEETVKRTLNQLFLLNGAAVLGLARVNPGAHMADNRIAKGVLGVLAAERWYSKKHPDALVISLDDPMSQRWILGATSDNRHGDLLALRSTADGVVVEAIEVKAHDDPDAGLQTRAGRVEGKAATQVDQTLQKLRSILALDSRSPVLRARREVLQDQFYRAVASRGYNKDQRKRLVRLLEELFTNGAARFGGLVFRVTIQAGVPSVEPSAPALHRSPAGNEVGLVDIVEGGAPVGFRASGGQVPQTPAQGAPAATQQFAATPTRRTRGRQDRGSSGSPRDPAVAPCEAAVGQINTEAPATAHKPRGARVSARDIKVLIGTAHSGAEVYWDPHRPDAPLNNFGFLVTGDSGTGKTQILRALISEIVSMGLSVCVFDNKNDYAKAEFSGPAGLRVYDIDQDGLPFNPLSLVGDERGMVQPIKQIHELAGILARVHKLGGQQEARLKAAMREAYERRGITPQMRIAVKGAPVAPSFEEVVDILRADPKNEALLNRLSPLFDLNLFPASEKVSTTFEQLLDSATVLDLHRLPTDHIRSVIAEFVIVRIHSHILRGEQPRELRRLLVFDEAWRVQESVRLQELAREGRAFGVGIAMGSQFPGDVHPDLKGNLATQLLLHNQDAEHRRAVVRELVGTTSGSEATKVTRQLVQLQKYEGFLRNQQHLSYVLMRTKPHHERVQSS